VLVNSEDEDYLGRVESEWAEYAGLVGFKLTSGQRWWFAGARRELKEKFFQEYPHTPASAFEAVRDGTYYAKLWRIKGNVWNAKERGRELFEPLLEVHTAWDLGRNDMMVIVFFQVHGSELRVVDEYHNTGEPLEHYANVLWDKRRDYGYSYGRHVLPHDAKVTDLSSDISRAKVLKSYGLKGLKVLRRTKDVTNDIEQVRNAIGSIWVDAGTCDYILKMFARYTKEWDEVRGTWKDKPKHDEWSNPADAIRYMVMARMHDSGTAYERSGGAVEVVKEGRRVSNVVDGMAI